MLTNNIFMKNKYIFQNKNSLAKRASLNIFVVPLMSELCKIAGFSELLLH